MLDRRAFLLSISAVGAFPPLAQADLLEKLKARREEQAANKQAGKRLKPITVDYGPALLDIYATEGAKNLPVFIHVHGGGWRNGTRTYVQSKPAWFVKSGWVFVSIDYRKLPEAPVSTQADDVAVAYRWVSKHIGDYGGDASRIIVSGHSAGCHLTALTGCRGDLNGAKGLVLCDVDVYDIQAQANRNALRQVHKDAFSDPSQWKALSPITYATRPHMPMLIAYSSVRGHKRSAVEFATALKKGGTRVELYDGSSYSHFSINRGFGNETGGFTGATMAFLDKYI
jgi:acetyl esterase/lipase